jgi:apolipoprotein N-acyltransferase
MIPPVRSSPLRFIAGLALAVLSGLLFFLALPPYPTGFLAWIALVPGICAQVLLAPRDRAARLYGAVTYALGIGLTVVAAFAPLGLPTSVPVALPIAGAALLVGGLVYLLALPTGTPTFHRRTRFRLFVVGPAVAWVGFEFLRMLIQLGHVWGWLSTSQADNLPIFQLAALGGPWLLSLVIVAVNYALALGLIALLSPADRKDAGRPAVVALLVLGVLLPAAYLWGEARSHPQPGTVRVAALQTGAELGDVYEYVRLWGARDWEGLSRAVLPDMAARTRQAAALGAQLVVWPEATIWLDPLDPANSPYTREQLAGLAQETNATLVVPYYILTHQGNLSWFLGFAPGQRNETLVVTPGGHFLGPYAKNHPIPFIGEVSSTRGKYPVYDLPFARVATMTGYDTAFTDVAWRLARGGAQLLTLSTHDWVGQSSTYGVQTRLRAVENGVSIVKCDWEVGSLVTDPYGRLLAAAPTEATADITVVADVPLGLGGTLYARIGDVLGWLCLGGMVILVAAPLLWRPRRGP